nr:MAG TPA: Endonuclease [Caudoviricetes sp.]
MSKYRAKKTEIDGIKFDSKKEAKRYIALRELEKKGNIEKLMLQPRFLLQEGFRKNGKAYRKIEYVADFMYEQDGKLIIEDVKGIKTDVYKLKQKLFEKKYQDLTIKEI